MYNKTHVEKHALLIGYEERYWKSRHAATHYIGSSELGSSELLRPTRLRQNPKVRPLGAPFMGSNIWKLHLERSGLWKGIFQQHLPAHAWQWVPRVQAKENGRFRYTTRELSGTHFLDDDKISGVSEYRFSFMTTSGSWIPLLVLSGTNCTWNPLVQTYHTVPICPRTTALLRNTWYTPSASCIPTSHHLRPATFTSNFWIFVNLNIIS
jgi:hypothetical protein